MSIESTQYISRERAIDRINEIQEHVKRKNFKAIEENSFEDDGYYVDLEWVDNFKIHDNIENYSDRMLEEILDQPFVRFSMFDNYIIDEEESYKFSTEEEEE